MVEQQHLNEQRQLLELDYYQHWFCQGRGRFAIENFSPLRHVLEQLIRLPGVREHAEQVARTPQQTFFNWQFDRLPPSFNHYRILQLSDLHIDAMAGLVEPILAAVSDSRPDIIVLTGDFRFATGGANHLMLEYMQQLVAGLPRCDGIYGILGNHDSCSFIKPFEALGIRMLVNETVELQRGSDRIALIGLDDCHYYGTDDLTGALRGVEPELFKLLLVHSPELFREAAGAEIDFYLCGHTHGGQIRLPYLGAPILNAGCPRRYCDRTWRHGRTQGYTHRGTGSSCVPLRINCPPEVTLHTLSLGDAA